MSRIEKCLMCSHHATFLCGCSSNTFLCLSHLQTHLTSVGGRHVIEPLRYEILPEDLHNLRNIQKSLNSRFEEKTQKILEKRTQNIRPLLERIQKIEKECKEEIKRVLKRRWTKFEK